MKRSVKLRLQWLWVWPVSAVGWSMLWSLRLLHLLRGSKADDLSWQHPSCPDFYPLKLTYAHGRMVQQMLQLYPFIEVDAICIGCVIFARDETTLHQCTEHEHIHVAQALRWGIVFPFAYLASSAWAWLQGKDAYLDNQFEREAHKM